MARDLEASLRGVDWGVCVRAEGADPETAGLASESLRTASMGTNTTVRADAGFVEGPGGAVTYAFLANLD